MNTHRPRFNDRALLLLRAARDYGFAFCVYELPEKKTDHATIQAIEYLDADVKRHLKDYPDLKSTHLGRLSELDAVKLPS